MDWDINMSSLNTDTKVYHTVTVFLNMAFSADYVIVMLM